jgi:hypothetical protein
MVPRSSLRGARATKQSIRHLVQQVWRISRRRNPPHHLEPTADYAALIRPTRPTRPCRLTPPSPRLLVTGSNPQFTSRRAFGPPQVLDLGQNGISARGAVSYRVPILSHTATHRYGIAPQILEEHHAPLLSRCRGCLGRRGDPRRGRPGRTANGRGNGCDRHTWLRGRRQAKQDAGYPDT